MRKNYKSKYGLEEIIKWFPEAYNIDDVDINFYIKKMENMKPSRDFRGKQEFQFFCLFVEKAKELLCKCRKLKGDYGIIKYSNEMKNISLNLAGGREEYMAGLTSFAETPDELNKYLEKMSRYYV